ncbi:DsrE family protein [Halomarina salina]|uniref:DsrE family protein n=1 Tax=Halomarina salina TaxID=1872699 RepID=A0ABD5RN31_9EURY|nr:DsrE family protein [Halomarina salina]
MDVVFHSSSGDSADHSHVLANVRNLLDDDTVALDELAVVLNGEAVRAVVAGSFVADDVATLADDVRFIACSNSLATRDIDPGTLVEGVERGSSGVGTVAKLQGAGYHYVKVP